MKFPKINFKQIAMETVGEAGGLFILGEAAKQKFVASQKPGFKGLIYKGGAALIKALAGKAKGMQDVVNGAASALSVAGTSQLMNAFVPGKVSVIGGYEDYPIQGPGLDMQEGDGPNGEGQGVEVEM